jgi:hypothetical protein
MGSFNFKEWINENATPTVLTAKRLPSGGISLKLSTGTETDEVKVFNKTPQGLYVVRTANMPGGMIVAANPAMGDKIAQWVKSGSTPTAAKSIDEIMFWANDYSRNPPSGWEPAMMEMNGPNALRAAYKKGIGPGPAHKIAEFVHLFSGKKSNVENRWLAWMAHKARQEKGDVETMELVQMKKTPEVQKIFQQAEQIHAKLMASGYKLPPASHNTGMTANIFF